MQICRGFVPGKISGSVWGESPMISRRRLLVEWERPKRSNLSAVFKCHCISSHQYKTILQQRSLPLFEVSLIPDKMWKLQGTCMSLKVVCTRLLRFFHSGCCVVGLTNKARLTALLIHADGRSWLPLLFSNAEALLKMILAKSGILKLFLYTGHYYYKEVQWNDGRKYSWKFLYTPQSHVGM